MKKNYLKQPSAITALAAAALLGLGTTSMYAEAKVIVDKDDDKRISQDEFASSSKPHLTTADDDKDGFISNEEMLKATFNAWDTNGNGEITLSEFNAGRDHFNKDGADLMTFKTWDQNNDNEVHMDEFKEGIMQTGLYTKLYTKPDVRVTVADYQGAVFSYYDLDGDGYIDAAEMPASGPLYVY